MSDAVGEVPLDIEDEVLAFGPLILVGGDFERLGLIDIPVLAIDLVGGPVRGWPGQPFGGRPQGRTAAMQRFRPPLSSDAPLAVHNLPMRTNRSCADTLSAKPGVLSVGHGPRATTSNSGRVHLLTEGQRGGEEGRPN